MLKKIAIFLKKISTINTEDYIFVISSRNYTCGMLYSNSNLIPIYWIWSPTHMHVYFFNVKQYLRIKVIFVILTK